MRQRIHREQFEKSRFREPTRTTCSSWPTTWPASPRGRSTGNRMLRGSEPRISANAKLPFACGHRDKETGHVLALRHAPTKGTVRIVTLSTLIIAQQSVDRRCAMSTLQGSADLRQSSSTPPMPRSTLPGARQRPTRGGRSWRSDGRRGRHPRLRPKSCTPPHPTDRGG